MHETPSAHGPVRRFLRRVFGGELPGIAVVRFLLGILISLITPKT